MAILPRRRGRHTVAALVTLFVAILGGPAAPADSPCADYPPDAASEDLIARVADSLSECTASLSERERHRLAAIIKEESQQHGYDPLFVSAIIQVESGCSKTARGPTGSLGLIQLQPRTAREVARQVAVPWRGTDTLNHPALNVRLGLAYLAQLEKRFRDPVVAMAAYNLGPERVARMSRPRARGAVYVRKVLSRYERLLARNGLDWF